MEGFTKILEDATASIPAEYFLLPLHGADPIYRERVYCYELYHQLRCLWPQGTLYRLNGEVDKAGHPYFRGRRALKPDFVVHQPGTGLNFAVVEVKADDASRDAIEKDLNSLTRFANEFGYLRAIYLIYGNSVQQTHRQIKNLIGEIPGSERIEIWLHPASGVPAALPRAIPMEEKS
jgi:hypothetical protein